LKYKVLFKMKEELLIRRWLITFMTCLFLSGVTAIPIETELKFLTAIFPDTNTAGVWLHKVYDGISNTNQQYPFLAYGYDWLAFAHFVLAILFIGPLKNPVKNKWVIEFGLIACLLIIPFAFISGYCRNIPLWWRLIDCSFGIIGFIPLWFCLKKINELEKNNKLNNN
jgi:hypothetical protein